MKNLFTFILFVSIIGTGQVFSQSKKNITVSGNASVNGEKPSVGIKVNLKGTNRTTRTDKKGYYKIDNVPADGILVFSRADAQISEVPVNNRSGLSVALAPKDDNVRH